MRARRVLLASLGLAVAGVAACAGELEDPDRFLTPAGAGGTAGAAGAAGAAGTNPGQGGSAGTAAGAAGAAGATAGSGGASAGTAGAAGSAAGAAGGTGLDFSKADTAKGKTLAGDKCAPCHGDPLTGASIVGSWAPNLTPDDATGLGTWSPDEIAVAMREGKAKDGSTLCFSMTRFTVKKLADTDLVDIVGYLKSMPGVSSPDQGTPCE